MGPLMPKTVTIAARSPMDTPASTLTPATSSYNALTSWLRDSISELDIPGAAVGVVGYNQRLTHATGVTHAGTEDAFTTSA